MADTETSSSTSPRREKKSPERRADARAFRAAAPAAVESMRALIGALERQAPVEALERRAGSALVAVGHLWEASARLSKRTV